MGNTCNCQKSVDEAFHDVELLWNKQLEDDTNTNSTDLSSKEKKSMVI